MQNKLNRLAILLVAALTILACSKDDNNRVILIDGTYKILKETYASVEISVDEESEETEEAEEATDTSDSVEIDYPKDNMQAYITIANNTFTRYETEVDEKGDPIDGKVAIVTLTGPSKTSNNQISITLNEITLYATYSLKNNNLLSLEFNVSPENMLATNFFILDLEAEKIESTQIPDDDDDDNKEPENYEEQHKKDEIIGSFNNPALITSISETIIGTLSEELAKYNETDKTREFRYYLKLEKGKYKINVTLKKEADFSDMPNDLMKYLQVWLSDSPLITTDTSSDKKGNQQFILKHNTEEDVTQSVIIETSNYLYINVMRYGKKEAPYEIKIEKFSDQ